MDLYTVWSTRYRKSLVFVSHGTCSVSYLNRLEFSEGVWEFWWGERREEGLSREQEEFLACCYWSTSILSYAPNPILLLHKILWGILNVCRWWKINANHVCSSNLSINYQHPPPPKTKGTKKHSGFWNPSFQWLTIFLIIGQWVFKIKQCLASVF